MVNTNFKIEYEALNLGIVNSISKQHHNILDVGCGTGNLGAYLKTIQLAKVDGITYSKEEAEYCYEKLDHVYICDLNNFDTEEILGKNYNCIICSHILEHLNEPWHLIKKLENLLSINGELIIAIPNIMFYKHRLQLLKGDFSYSLTGGIFDITHYRFFDWNSTSLLLSQTNLKLIEKYGNGNFPLPFIRRFFPKLGAKIDLFFVKKFPNLFSEQFIIKLLKHK